MKLVYSPKQESYQSPYVLHYGHQARAPEVSQRPREIAKALIEAELGEIITPRSFPLDFITDVHAPDYLEYMKTGPFTPMMDPESAGKPIEVLYPSIWPFSNRWPVKANTVMAKVGYYCFDTETPIMPDTYDAALLSADCALTAADVLRETGETAYALCRPPGHHAMKHKCGGYCYLNNAAIAAAHLSKGGRVAILDVDYHHGNGTQDIFYDTDQVLFVSIHANPEYAYPHYSGFEGEKGAGAGTGFNVNLVLESGTGYSEYSPALEKALAAIRQYAPTYLVVSLGLDTFEHDPICDFKLPAAYYSKMAEDIAALELPSLIIQEGGYNLENLGRLVTNFLEGWQ